MDNPHTRFIIIILKCVYMSLCPSAFLWLRGNITPPSFLLSWKPILFDFQRNQGRQTNCKSQQLLGREEEGRKAEYSGVEVGTGLRRLLHKMSVKTQNTGVSMLPLLERYVERKGDIRKGDLWAACNLLLLIMASISWEAFSHSSGWCLRQPSYCTYS